MLYFHVWRQNVIKFLVLSEYYDQFDIYQPSCVSFSEPPQRNLSTPGAHWRIFCQNRPKGDHMKMNFGYFQI